MAEEKTQETQSSEPKEEKKTSEKLKMLGKMILGVVLFVLGVWAVIAWWRDLWTVFKGCIGLFLALAGVITIAIARE